MSDETVLLDVGGQRFRTTRATLLKDDDCVLAKMFDGRLAPALQEDGCYFIDRDGTQFRHILNFLRDGSVALPADTQAIEEIRREASYYLLQGLLDALPPPRLGASSSLVSTLLVLLPVSGALSLRGELLCRGGVHITQQQLHGVLRRLRDQQAVLPI